MDEEGARERRMYWFSVSEEQLFDRNIHLGADGSEIHEGSNVYILARRKEGGRIKVVEHFIIANQGRAMGLICGEGERVPAGEMIPANEGRTVRAITRMHMQIKQRVENRDKEREERIGCGD